MYFELKWDEPRLRGNKSANANGGMMGYADHVSTSMLHSKYFWYPDIDLHGVQKKLSPTFHEEFVWYFDI